jgi:archaellum component FlaC
MALLLTSQVEQHTQNLKDVEKLIQDLQQSIGVINERLKKAESWHIEVTKGINEVKSLLEGQLNS